MTTFDMPRFFCSALVFLSLGLFLTGCKPRQGDAAFALIQSGRPELSDTQRNKEEFNRSLELINNLDDSPCLPNTPGFEKLVSVADRLDKWIRHQKPDDMWKPEPAFQEVERAAADTADTAAKVVRALALLQGETVLDEAGQPAAASESLQAERQAVTAGLAQFVAQTRTLAALAQLPSMNQFSQKVSELQKKFAELDNVPNLSAGVIRSFAKLHEDEARVFAVSAAMFELYALQLKTGGLFMTASDVEYLKQSVWMRDLSKWTDGGKRVLLNQAVEMCDWVVCNIEMRSNWIPVNQQQSIEVLPQHPWQTILLGYGTAQDRMTVFLELLRQQRIDAALLAVPHPDDPSVPLYWSAGVLLDGEVYVFLLNEGFPMPGAEGVQAGDDGSLHFTNVAALSQLMQDDSLLRRLDLSEDLPFPVTAEMLKQSTAHLFLMPESVSMRMKVLEAELDSEQSMVLYTDPQELRRRFLDAPGITGVECWKYPFRTAFEQRFNPEATNEAMNIFLVGRPRHNLDDSANRRHYPLWSGRILYFRGAITGQENAITKYQNTRVSDKEMIEYRADPMFRNNPALNVQLQWLSIQAGFWLGTALFEIDSTGAAKESLMEIRTSPLNMWRNQTEYLLGRIAEREKRYDDARRHYSNTASSLSGAGNALRARRLP